MPKDPRIKKVLVIGSGPIIIGQAAEFDYSGTQACRALKSEGVETVLVNSNPATIMTDPDIADHVYIEPLTAEVIERIIEKEKPDAILPNLGGQMGLNLSMELARNGFLDRSGVRLLACKPDTIDRAEDRQLFKDTMEKLHQPIIPSKVVEDLDDALDFAEVIGYPVIVRPAFTMGGTGGGICEDREKLHEIATNGLRLSPIHQILVEKCISGWKEIEYEVMRDSKGNVITVCNMENLDPVGIHTGDSIVVAPSQTLSDKEYQMLRTAALDIITELGIEGGCNCQFALKPDSFEYAVIEVNPRVSRSSALASKATGYPIAKVATKIALGYTLDEITNDVTGETCACFEPALDYVVVKYPKWPFDKFVYADKSLGTQMMATGEVMAIGNNFEHAMMKAVSSTELGLDTMTLPDFEKLTTEEVIEHLHVQDSERAFCVYEALKRGVAHDVIYDITKIDWWFLDKLQHLADIEMGLKNGELTTEKYLNAKRFGFLDKTIKRLAGVDTLPESPKAAFKMVDTCAAEFAAKTPYFYSTYDEDNEAKPFIAERSDPDKKKVLVFGSGPIRIGQGIEFDYCSVHAVWTLKQHGCEAILVNNNPETVSTDFDTGDRLYFDPLNPESVDHIIETEKPDGCLVQFGGQTAIKLAKHMDEIGLPILGTPADAIDEAEDRERFDELLERCGIPRPEGRTVFTLDEALQAAQEVGYPVLMRPSYVLGGQNMIVAYNSSDVIEYMGVITKHVDMSHPVLMDKYILGTECEVDAICDGTDYLVPGIMQQVERTGVHSGDSISVYPPYSLSQTVKDRIAYYTEKLGLGIGIKGLFNIQFIVDKKGDVYIIEVNPRASRSVPFLSKSTGVNLVEMATRVMLGQSLAQQGIGNLHLPEKPIWYVKAPAFSFAKLGGMDTYLSPEMKSTGEAIGYDRKLNRALYKALQASGIKMKEYGTVIVTLADEDKEEGLPLARRFYQMGFNIEATEGTAAFLKKHGIRTRVRRKLSDGSNEILTSIRTGFVSYILNTRSIFSREHYDDGRAIRECAVQNSVNTFTSLDTARIVLDALEEVIPEIHTIDENV